jgi:hypothetical protein
MGTTQARIFRMARAEIGDRDINPRVFDEVWSETVNFCLEQGLWNFAMVTATLATQGGVAQFGYTYPYPKPSGYVRSFIVSASDDFHTPFEDYADAKNQIHANVTPLYLSYVSNATDAGFYLTNWPETFSVYVAGELARRVSMRSAGGRDEYNEIGMRVKKYLADARSKDAMNEGVAYPPEGRWVKARRHWGGSGDRGNRGSLTG